MTSGSGRVPRIAIPIGLVVAVLAWGEWMHWRSAGRRLGPSRAGVGREAVVVLGFRNRGTRANAVNRYRVRTALRAMDPSATESVLVLCGGRVGSTVSEADVMLRYARAVLGHAGPVRIEQDSRSTWENIRNATALIEGFDTIKIVSNALHAEKARAYLWQQRPDLATRLARSDERLGEMIVLKPLAAWIGWLDLHALARPDPPPSPTASTSPA